MPSDVEMWAQLKDSEYWKLIERTLDVRREMLFATELSSATTPEQMCKAQGAIAEVTRLKNLPNLALAHMTEQAERQRAMAQERRDPEDFDG
jgi:hypothetical protein